MIKESPDDCAVSGSSEPIVLRRKWLFSGHNKFMQDHEILFKHTTIHCDQRHRRILLLDCLMKVGIQHGTFKLSVVRTLGR